MLYHKRISTVSPFISQNDRNCRPSECYTRCGRFYGYSLFHYKLKNKIQNQNQSFRITNFHDRIRSPNRSKQTQEWKYVHNSKSRQAVVLISCFWKHIYWSDLLRFGIRLKCIFYICWKRFIQGSPVRVSEFETHGILQDPKILLIYKCVMKTRTSMKNA